MKSIKKNQNRAEDIITEIKNTLQEINSRLDGTEEWFSELGDRVVAIAQAE